MMLLRSTFCIQLLLQSLIHYSNGLSIPSVLKRLVPFRSSTKKYDHHVQSLLLTRRTINAFEPTLPKDWESVVETAVTAATYAPNHKRTEPWRFHLLGENAIRRVCELNARLVSEKKGPAAGDAKLERWLQMPGWMVVTQVVDDNSNNDWKIPNSLLKEDYAAVCCAVQNFCLSLHSQGYGTKWTTGPVNFDDAFKTAVGALPDNEQVVGTIWFGIPAGTAPSTPVKKLTMDTVLCRHD
mmetsp:Transcript_12278/g.18828  ORF Transcript_12278/g.18828 Transcript_12278/m.18828 type:complete len:239 (+) Transcript_12278:89-805(+)|eukprot:CAMPEP_0178894654 /NCGR_PEP_ID=MMETSP0786-20121207/137_1 /TAXON_ID=186022 /ORGANISM="Thalassionema frauenfeldii, Strain CCMP 1798" /LENGTH=238 /DNA_ID=CAMNT_0020564769 /DNA_START=12 /DNA_END=728 /DNA_ORIENTATION=+